ncbi:hypothetical protein ACHAWF_003279, partial [Thalassiosira exigua]
MALRSNSSSFAPCPATSFAAAGAPSLGSLSVRNRLPSVLAKLRSSPPTNASSSSSPSNISWPTLASPTPVYNDNEACVNWSKKVTSRGIKHYNLKENKVRKVHAAGDATITHIPSTINSSDIFTKEMKISAHFHRLRDSFMVSLGIFLK